MRQPVTRIEGTAIPFGRANVDTDTIIPAAYLKSLTRIGLGEHLFEPLRRAEDNLFDDPRYRDAPILIAGGNFGCGSSREHAVWALLDFGIRVVIAPSFSDIFASNAFRNGLLTVELPAAETEQLVEAAAETVVAVDLVEMEVEAAGKRFGFSLDPFRREFLMHNLDEIDVTLRSEEAIAAYENRSPFSRLASGGEPGAAAGGR